MAKQIRVLVTADEASTSDPVSETPKPVARAAEPSGAPASSRSAEDSCRTSLVELERIRERAERKDTLAALLGVKILPRPGTIFRLRGSHHYYMTEHRILVEVSEPAYCMLRSLLLGDTLEEAILRLAPYPEVSPESILEHLRECARRGYFLPPPPRRAAARARGQSVKRLLAHHPMKMMLLIAQSCNLRCRYCYGIEGNYHDAGALMTREVAEAAVDYLLTRGAKREHFIIYFFGGEPLLNFEVLKHTVEYAKSETASMGKTVEFGVTTNGTLLSDSVCRYLTEEDFQIVVSLDGPPDVHDSNRITCGGGGSSPHVLRGLDRLRPLVQRRGQLKIRATMCHQHHDPLTVADYFESLGLEKVGIGSAVERAGARQTHDLQDSDYDDLEGVFEDYIEDFVCRLQDQRPLRRYNPFLRGIAGLAQGDCQLGIGCGLCRNDQGIGTDGKIYPCHRYVGMEKYVLGDVFRGVDTRAVSRVYSQFFAMLDRHCGDCWARHLCSGGCPWQHSHDDGTVRDPSPTQCRVNQRGIQMNLWLSNHLARTQPSWFKQLTRGGADSAVAEGS